MTVRKMSICKDILSLKEGKKLQYFFGGTSRIELLPYHYLHSNPPRLPEDYAYVIAGHCSSLGRVTEEQGGIL